MSATYERLHDLMIQVYGKNPDRVCRDCVHLVGTRSGVACELASTSIRKPDWRSYLMACGKFEEGKEARA